MRFSVYIVILCVVFLFPQLIYAQLYSFFSAIYMLGTYDLYDLIYFSFCLSYSVPMIDNTMEVFQLQKDINKIYSGRIIQFVHLLTLKFNEVTIISVIASVFLDILGLSKRKG